VRVGLYVDMRNAPPWRRPWGRHYRRWLDRFAEAERLGADVIWLTEHHFFEDGYLPQCWTLAAAIAARTERIRIGSAVALLPLHRPIEVAEQLALVDVISDGRIEPGFGVGYRKPEYLAFAGDFKRRYHVYEESIRELRQLWGEEPGAERVITPGPIQRPVPIWGGFQGPQGARLAGRLGLGLQSAEPGLLEPYLEGLAAGEHPISTARMSASYEFFVTDDPEKTWAEIGDHVMYRWNSYNRYMYEGTRRESDPTPHYDTAAIKRRFLLGSAAQIADAIRARVGNLPVTDVYTWSDYPGLPDDLVDQHIEAVLTQVAPLLREIPTPLAA
jgi:alkanesulfonate monooxygenase SsuD/methylene tetrahydromethanopterin reductase-like flavin-dependent oxidoreductase (luciferase family)